MGTPTTSVAFASGALSNAANVPAGSLTVTAFIPPPSSAVVVTSCVSDSAAPLAGVVRPSDPVVAWLLVEVIVPAPGSAAEAVPDRYRCLVVPIG